MGGIHQWVHQQSAEEAAPSPLISSSQPPLSQVLSCDSSTPSCRLSLQELHQIHAVCHRQIPLPTLLPPLTGEGRNRTLQEDLLPTLSSSNYGSTGITGLQEM